LWLSEREREREREREKERERESMLLASYTDDCIWNVYIFISVEKYFRDTKKLLPCLIVICGLFIYQKIFYMIYKKYAFRFHKWKIVGEKYRI